MFFDYERLVLAYYQWKMSQNKLTFQLSHPTQARIKKECVRLCRGKLQNKDEKVVRDFCEEWDNTRTCLQNIHKCGVDKFKPLSNFLKRDTESTEPKNIHLLAWLIDLPDRPFDNTKKYEPLAETLAGAEMLKPVESATVDTVSLSDDLPAIEMEKNNMVTEVQLDDDRSKKDIEVKGNPERTTYIGNVNGGKDVVQDNQPHIEQGRLKWRFPKVAMVGVLLALIGTSSYWWWDPRQEDGGCMYWADDHFQQIPCNQKIPNVLVVALDTPRLKTFKKITRPDTITRRSKGYVWYSKIDNEFEFFTADGEHPVIIGRHLKPITDFIIDNRIPQQ